MAIITIAGYKLLKITDRRDWRLWAISATVFGVTALTGSEPVPMILADGIMMLLLDARPSLHRPWRHKPRRPPKNGSGMRLQSWSPALLLPLSSGRPWRAEPCWPWVFSSCRPAPWSSAPAWPSCRCCATASSPSTTWLTQGQFLDAVAMGLITPGPVVITAGFIGYLVAGLPGAITATVAIFTPIYLAVIIPGRWFIRHRDNKQVKAFVAGGTAAAPAPSPAPWSS